MPIPTWRKNTDGSLIPFTAADVAALGLKSRGVRDHSGGRRSMSAGSSTRKLKWFCNPDKLFDAAVFLYGAASVVTDSGTGNKSLSRIMPWTCPDDPKVGVTHIDSEGFKFTQDDIDDEGVPVPGYQDESLECTLELLPFELESDEDFTGEYYRYVERMGDEGAAQYVTMPGAAMGLKFRKSGGGGPDGKGVPYNTGFTFVKGKISRKWHRVPRTLIETGTALFKRIYGDPSAVVAADRLPYVNTCNQTTFDGFAPGTLVLLPPKVEPWYDPVAGDWCVNITYTWDWLPHGANYLYYFDSAGTDSGWYLASRGSYAAPGTWADRDVLFPAREHMNLFEVGTV